MPFWWCFRSGWCVLKGAGITTSRLWYKGSTFRIVHIVISITRLLFCDSTLDGIVGEVHVQSVYWYDYLHWQKDGQQKPLLLYTHFIRYWLVTYTQLYVSYHSCLLVPRSFQVKLEELLPHEFPESHQFHYRKDRPSLPGQWADYHLWPEYTVAVVITAPPQLIKHHLDLKVIF